MPRFISRNTSSSILVNGVSATAPNTLSCANAASLNPTAAVTLECWFMPRFTRASFVLFDNSTIGTTNSYLVLIDSAGRTSFFSTIGGAASNISNATSLRVAWNAWNFMHVTYTGAVVNMFLNGSQFTEQLSRTGAMGTNSGILRIGAYFTGGDSLTLNGYIYKPRIYNVGITLADHQNRYYKDFTSTAMAAGLVLDPSFTGSGATIADLSGNNNTITINSSASWTTLERPFVSRSQTTTRTQPSGRTQTSGRSAVS